MTAPATPVALDEMLKKPIVAPALLNEMLKNPSWLNEEIDIAISVKNDVDRVAFLIKHAPADRHFRDLIYQAQLEVAWNRPVDPELDARRARILEIVIERFEELEKAGAFDETCLASIRKMRKRYLKSVAEEKRDAEKKREAEEKRGAKTCDAALWCGGEEIAEDDGEAFVCDECDDAVCGNCFQEIGCGFTCTRCGQQYCDPCCNKPEIEALIGATTCKKCEKKKKISPAAKSLAPAAAKKKKVDPIA